MSELGKLVDIEESEIDAFLNAIIVNALGLGMYTVIYCGTMYIYVTKSSSKRYIVPATITVLFLCNVIQTAVQWYAIQQAFVDKGDTRDSVFVSLFEVPNWAYVSVDIANYIGYVLADGLLVWRCFFVWNRSFRVISILLCLIITEITLFLVLIVFRALYGGALPSAALAARFNGVLFAASFTNLATTFVATILIAYKIFSASKQGVSKRRFRHILNIVIQSGAVYSLVILVSAISPVLLADGNVQNTWAIAFNLYTTALVSAIAGMSTTVLVARVSMLPTDTTFPSTSIHLSGLQFHVRSTHLADNPEDMETTRAVDVERNLIDEGLQVENKV